MNSYVMLDAKDEKRVKEKLGVLAHKTPRIISLAANDAMKTARATVAKEVTKIYYMRAKDVNETLDPKSGERATVARPYAKLTYKSSFQNIAKWKQKGRSVVSPGREVKSAWTQTPPDPKKGYKARIKRAGGFKPLSHNPKPFLRTAKSGTFGMFVRESDDPDADIRGVAAPDITQLISNKDVIATMQEKTGAQLQKRLAHHIEQALGGSSY